MFSKEGDTCIISIEKLTYATAQGWYSEKLVSGVQPASENPSYLTLCKNKISDFPYSSYDVIDTLFETKMAKIKINALFLNKGAKKQIILHEAGHSCIAHLREYLPCTSATGTETS